MGDLPVHETGDEKSYRWAPICGKTLRFTLRAPHDCHIGFSSTDGDSDPMFEVFIGCWEGAASAVRFNKGQDLVKVDTPDILSEDEPREFWIAFDHDDVRVGRGGEFEPFMRAALPEHVEVTHFGYSTGYGASGSFCFLHECCKDTCDKLEYNFEPMYGDTITFRVSCDHDAHLSFTMAPEETPLMYEIFIGAWENQNSAIRKSKETTVLKVETPEECNGTDKRYYVSIRDGFIKVGRLGEIPFMEWQDPEPFKVTHFGYCTGWGSCGNWSLNI